jgi:uncharacterized membrane protein YoaK (UPF0700 family)
MMQEARQERILPQLLYLFTAVTGLVDAVSYIGLGHIFTANMTGNIVLLGFAFAGVPGLSVLRSLTALAAFLVGAVIGGRLATTMASLSSNRWRLTAFGFETVFLLLPHFPDQHRSGGSRADTIDKVTPRDLTVHSQTAVIRIHAASNQN